MKTRFLMDHLHVAHVLFYNQWLFSNTLVVDASMHPRWWWYQWWYLARLQSAFLMGRGCHSEMNQWCPTLSNHQVSTVAPCLYHHSQRSHQSSEFANATALLAQDFTSPPRQWWKVELWVTKQVIKRVLNKYTPITTVSDCPENYCGSSKRMKKYFCKTWWHSIIPCRKRFWFVPCFKHDCQARSWVESLLHVNMWRAEKERHLNFYRHKSIRATIIQGFEQSIGPSRDICRAHNGTKGYLQWWLHRRYEHCPLHLHTTSH